MVVEKSDFATIRQTSGTKASIFM